MIEEILKQIVKEKKDLSINPLLIVDDFSKNYLEIIKKYL